MRHAVRAIYKGLILLVVGAAAIACCRASDLDQERIGNARAPTFHAELLAQTEKPQRESDELKRRGKELRAALQRRHLQLVVNNVRIDPVGGVDATDAVLPYIPVGTSFSDAEAILRHAGFVIGKHPNLNAPPDINRGKDWYAVVAEISPFSTWLLVRTDFYVELLPRSPGDYSTVSKVSASFFITGP
jgi:hypothetical protein